MGRLVVGHFSVWAVSSVVEHRLYTPAATGSNPVPPTRIGPGPVRRDFVRQAWNVFDAGP